MHRMPAVANQFYPGDPLALRDALEQLIPAREPKKQARLVISPHAGYVYSGGVAGATFAEVAIPGTALILGPNHHGTGEPLALGVSDWSMPLGEVPIDRELAVAILRRSEIIVDDDSAHRLEHSLEVQVPFLQYLRPDIQIVPLVVSHVSYRDCCQAATDLAMAIRSVDHPVLLVASTDMTHYEPRQQASAKDRLALEQILALNPAGLYETVHAHRISMCGVVPTTIALLAAMDLGATRAELVQYTDSGDVSGDISQVVGYAGVVVS